ncbi:tyrosine-type recombinase/integrase [Paraburkholderia dokdonensis]|uniref:tyrosine-type recombinase/integrase n=1 Tax=Paraburkholderia dokdonensis TaxID=2211211 RepID=UPI00101A0B2B|nr:integrase arm-type DNA-binding domain-containing protein [Paraburkholderia dokdonensis]
MGQLTDLKVKNAEHCAKDYWLPDGDGLYLRVRPTRKIWVYRYMRDGKNIKLSLGRYPIVSLAAARRKAREEMKRREDGIDPQKARREKREQEQAARLNTFELVAREWHQASEKDRQWSAGYAEKIIRYLELHVFPWVGRLSVEEIKPTEVVRCLHRIKERGNLETAMRVRETIQHVYQYAVDTGVLEPAKNFVNGRTGGLPAVRSRRYPAITDPQQLGQLLRDIRAYNGHVITRAALQLAPLLFQRPGQLRFAHWEDIDLDGAVWICPPGKMKMREWKKRDSRTPAHVVPLPSQAMEILRDLHPLTGPKGPIFRSVAKRSEATRYMSENTVNSALRTLGYDTKEQITGHGFRATARTLIREYLGWDREVIERHLAHASSEELGDSYDRATFLEQRREMVQDWADFLDELAAGNVPKSARTLRLVSRTA